jgi:phosphoesterase RecJ-like protein
VCIKEICYNSKMSLLFRKTIDWEILDSIKKSKHILLHLHVKPDPDSLGSALAMYWFCKKINKKCTLIRGDGPLNQNLSFFPGFENIALKKYSEINLAEFDLFIILDSASPQMISRETEIEFPPNLKTIVIDHHKTNLKYGNLNLIDSNASATCEIVFYLFKKWGVKIDQNMAAGLYLGIFADTGGFRHPSTTVTTFQAVLELVKIYPNFSELIESLGKNNYPDQVYFQSIGLNNLEILLDNKLALTIIPLEKIQEKNINLDYVMGGDLANFLIGVKDWQVGLILIEIKKNKFSGNLRSKQNIDVSKIAEYFGGGGHKNAAGFDNVEIPIETLKEKIITEIKNIL